MFRTNSIKRQDLFVLLAILCIATLFRLGCLGITEFRYDEVYHTLMAKELVSGRSFPTLGVRSSMGTPHPPISIYVLALPYMLSSNPLIAAMFVAALNVAGVGLLWLLARRYFSQVTAGIAGLVYAFSPWAILHSRKVWQADYDTPFALAGLTLGLVGFVEGKRWAQSLCLPVLLIAAQIHYGAGVLLLLYPLLLWIGRKHLKLIALAVSFLLGGATLIPFAIGLEQSGEASSVYDLLIRRGIEIESFAPREQPWLDLAGLATGLRMETWIAPDGAVTGFGLGTETWVTPYRTADFLEAVPPYQFWTLIGVVMALGLARIWARYRYAALLVSVWVITPALILSLNQYLVWPYYQLPSVPALCLLAGVGMEWLGVCLRYNPVGKLAVTGVFGAILLTQGIWWYRALNYIDSHFVYGVGVPMGYMLEVRQQVAEYDDVVIVNQGIQPWAAMLNGEVTCVREVAIDSGGMLVFPEGPFAAVSLWGPGISRNMLYESDDPTLYPIFGGDGTYSVSVFDQAPEWLGLSLIELSPVSFDNGVQLTGYDLEPDRLTLEWVLPEARPESYQYFGHFLDASGERLGQVDPMFWPGGYWCEGDHLITWEDINRPQDTEILRVGLYIHEDGHYNYASVMDDAGNLLAPWIDIPLIEP